MKKQLFLNIAGIVFILCSLNIYASDSSPWGAEAVWPKFPVGPTFAQACTVYNKELDSAQVGGFSWDRPNCLPSGENKFDIC